MQPGAVACLSRREREVLALVARGLTSRQIAAELGVAPSTVESQLRWGMRKLGVTTRVQAVARVSAADAAVDAAAESRPPLSPDERRLLACLAEGLTLVEAGQLLYMSRRSVDRRLAALRRRLGVATTAEAVARAGSLPSARRPLHA